MKVNIGTNIPQSETHGTLELKTNTKKEVKKLKGNGSPAYRGQGR